MNSRSMGDGNGDGTAVGSRVGAGVGLASVHQGQKTGLLVSAQADLAARLTGYGDRALKVLKGLGVLPFRHVDNAATAEEG